MSRQITQPVNQVRLTNVAIVRLSRGGNRFEVACYRNKIVNYRQGTETDLSEVLQTTTVFTNVSKGKFAKSSLLQECFGTTDQEQICRSILEKGDVQISDQERTVQLESTLREVASMVSEKCVNPINRRPYTMAQVRDAMKSAGFMVHPTRNIKQQFLDCVRLLQETKVLNVERAKMQLALELLPLEGDNQYASRRNLVCRKLIEGGLVSENIEPSKGENDARITFLSDPALYRLIENIAKDASVHARLEILRQCVAEVGDVPLGSELERRAQQQQTQHQTYQNGTELIEVDEQNEDISNVSNLLNQRLSDIRLTNNTGPTQIGVELPSGLMENSCKSEKAAQKKSKKAKRREKEEQVERNERKAAESERLRERSLKLGIGENVTENMRLHESSGPQMGESKPCNTCGGHFSPTEFRSHFRSDWHRYNVTLKMRGVAPVSENEFSLCDSNAFFE